MFKYEAEEIYAKKIHRLYVESFKQISLSDSILNLFFEKKLLTCNLTCLELILNKHTLNIHLFRLHFRFHKI